MLKFGDYLSNALHEIKRHSGKKISVLMDELGYGFEPELSGDTIESWRYRKAPPTLAHLETLARLLVAYKAAEHGRDWLSMFLLSAEHPYPQAICDELFPAEAKPDPGKKENRTQASASPVVTLPPPALKAYSPPAVSGFVGRQPALTHYKASLKKQTFAAISGMAGVGKTTLMSVLAADLAGEHAVFWHSFASGTVEPLVIRLAGFIANLGRPELWQMAEAARSTGGRPPAVETLFDMLGVILGEVPDTLLLCFDDLQFVDEDVRLQPFLQKLFDHTNVNVIITTRRYPAFFPVGYEQQLAGLDAAETAELLHNRQLDLSYDLVERLTELTGGNGAFLTLAAVILKDARDPEAIIGRLAREDDVERFLMEEVNDRLGNSEQRVMEAVAILRGHPGTREVLEEMLNVRDVNRTLRGLVDQYLLLTSISENDDGERVYSQHQIIQAFFYDQPRSSRRRELHMRAADFYEHERPDPFRAMLHHAQAGQLAPLVSLADSHFYAVVNQGDGKSLLAILADVDLGKSNLPETQLVKFLLARGRLQTILGELKPAEVDLKQGADMLNRLSQTAETDRLKGEVCLAMGELLERQDPPEALRWVQRGLELSAGRNDEATRSGLRITEGILHHHMGNFGEALESLQDGIEQLPAEQTAARANALNSLGAVTGMLGDLAQAKAYALEALELGRRAGDHLEVSRVLTNLGWFQYVLGERQAAVQALESGVEIARRIGSLDSEMSIQINLGGCFVEMGEDQKASHHLTRGAELAQAAGSHQLITALIRLAELAIREENWEQATEQLSSAEALAHDKNDQAALAGIFGFQALAMSGLGQLEPAAELARKAVSLDRMLGDQWSLGINLRVQGRVAWLNENLSSAQESFEHSIKILDSVDPFQAAISRWAWGQIQMELGNETRAIQLVELALDQFSQFKQSPEYAQAKAWLENLLAKNP